jgi:hypothetical protein
MRMIWLWRLVEGNEAKEVFVNLKSYTVPMMIIAKLHLVCDIQIKDVEAIMD